MKTPDQTEKLVYRLPWSALDKNYLRQLIRAARDEDLAGLGLATPPAIAGDATTALTPGADKPATARLVARRDCVICGLPLLPEILAAYAGTDCKITTRVADGAHVARGQTVAEIKGPAGIILTAERVLLNFLQKLTGIATLTNTYAEKLAGTRTKLLDTRKTTPGWRMLEKYAVATGGGRNHRLGLFDRVMLKDNHLAAGHAAAGERLAALVRKARSERPDLLVECETDSLEQIAPVLDAGADVILLDNFSPENLKSALAQIADKAWTEASGGITLENIAALAALGPDFISTGALTHQATWTDIGLDWE